MSSENSQSSAPSASRCYVFFGIRCEVYSNENTHKYYPSFPYRFRVWRKDGTQIDFAGILNYCETPRSAMMRAKARCKWLADETYDKRYT